MAYIQQNISFSLGYLVPFISMILALVIFVAVKSKYKQTPPGGRYMCTKPLYSDLRDQIKGYDLEYNVLIVKRNVFIISEKSQ